MNSGMFLENHILMLNSKLEAQEGQISNLEDELTDMRQSGTPRPDWRRCGPVVEGGSERWSLVMKGKSSDQLMDILLDDLTHLR